ncbi:Integrase catalytic core protein, partial [Globisporangium splendens]
MSPTQASSDNFPRLNGTNFLIWKARVTTSLKGKGLYGFIEKRNYEGDTESDSSDWEDLDPEASMDVDMEDLVPPPSKSSANSSGSDDSDNESSAEDSVPPKIISFAARKREEEEKRAMKAKVKNRKPSASKLRKMEARTRAFLFKTIDDMHVLIVDDQPTAYDVFQTLCHRYQGTKAHGDPYWIQHYLMEIKYEEGSDVTRFFLDLEEAMRNTSDATSSIMNDEQKPIYLYHSMPAEWKMSLNIWKGNRKFIPYEELKQHIEQKVRDDAAKSKYTHRFGTPESRETREEKALAIIGQPNATPSSSLCGYCERAGHETRECKTLGRHLLAGTVKPGTVIPENFKVTPTQAKPQKKAQKKRFQPYNQLQHGQFKKDKRSNAFNAAALAANTVYDKNGFPLDPKVLLQISQQAQAAALAKRVDDGNYFQTRKGDFGIIAVTDKLSREMVLAAKAPSEVDPVWTVDSGSTSHVAYQANWFTSMKPGVGSITVGGNHKIPIKGIGQADIEVKDKKGVVKTITLENVLYAPDLKFNLFSVSQATDDSFKVTFEKSGKCYLRPTSRNKNSPTWLPQRKSDLYDCYEDFRKKALNVFHNDVGTIEYCENQFSPEIQRFQADNAREYEKLGRIIFAKYKTHAQFTNAYTPQQNGVAERRMRTLLERVRAHLIDGNLPKALWGKNKLDARAKKCMFVGLPTHKKGYRLIDVSTGTTVYSRDVQFDETNFPTLKFLHNSRQNRAATIQPFDTRPTFEPCGAEHLLPPFREALSLHKDSQVRMACTRKLDYSNPSNAITITDRATENDNSTQTVHKDLYEIHSLLSLRHEDEPKSYKQAMASPEAIHWRLAAESEYSSLIENKTWTLVTLPPNRKALKCRWVWTKKYKGDGKLDRYKARLVIKGFLQKYGIDYNEIFAPVIRMEVLRLLLTIAALLDYEIHQMDVKTAFLNGKLDDEIYMEQPDGFVRPGQEHLVCKLLKSLYGLKQAPRIWYHTLRTFLEHLGFQKLIKDQCVFVGTVYAQVCYIAVYVDDLLIICPSVQPLQAIKSALNKEFTMSDLGEVHYLLGWSIVRNRSTRSVFIHQEKYAKTVLNRFNHLETHSVSTPVEKGTILTKDMCPQTQDEKASMDNIPYREAVGSFMYLMMSTRPDLAYFLREVSQFVDNPGKEHWNAVKRGLKYLKGTTSLGITLETPGGR